MFNLLLEAGNQSSSIVMLIVLGVLIIAMLVLPSMSQKKRIQAYKEMQGNLKAGDKVQTVGGVIGRIVRINEKDGLKTMILETGDKNNKMYIEFNLDAIAGVVTNPNMETATAAPMTEEAEVQEAETEEPTIVDVDFEEKPEEKPEEKKEPAKKKNSSKKK